MFVLWSILGIILILFTVMVIRAIRFEPGTVESETLLDVDVDIEKAAKHLSDTIQFVTISRPHPADVDWDEFDKLNKYLVKAYPLIHKHLKREVVADHSLLYHWKGSGNQKPLALLAHLDVVPVMPGTEGDWEQDAFSGHVDDRFIWGRGTMDMKGQLIAVLEAVETLLQEGYKPVRDIYLCFGHNEEVVGSTDGGAQAIADLLKERSVELGCVLDEGGAIVPGTAFNIQGKLAAVGIAEKGYADIKITVRHPGGHASQPPRKSGLVQVCDAVLKLEKNPFKSRFVIPTKALFDTIGPYMGFGMRLIFANTWLTKPILLAALGKKPGTNAMIRTTAVPTMAQGSPAGNVLPQMANVSVNSRILQGEKIQDVMNHIKRVANNSNLELEILRGKEPSATSPVDNDEFKMVQKTLRQIFGPIPVAPYLMTGGTDSCYYENLTDNIYCISPFDIGDNDIKRIHGTDERIEIAVLKKGIAFFIAFMKNYCS